MKEAPPACAPAIPVERLEVRAYQVPAVRAASRAC